MLYGGGGGYDECLMQSDVSWEKEEDLSQGFSLSCSQLFEPLL